MRKFGWQARKSRKVKPEIGPSSTYHYFGNGIQRGADTTQCDDENTAPDGARQFSLLAFRHLWKSRHMQANEYA
jgi:hypothetical protein